MTRSMVVFSLLLMLLNFFLHTTAEASTINSTEKFYHSVVLDTDNHYHLFWKFDNKSMTFEVHCTTQGYIGFGLSPNGGMKGADIAIGGVKPDGTKYFSDYHAIGEELPIKDAVQNWELLEASATDTFTILKFKRDLDTCDDNDIIITSDTMRVIWTYGTSDNIEYHGNRRGSKSIQLTPYRDSEHTVPNTTVTWDFKMDQVQIPSADTTYWCQAFQIPSLDRKHHAIQFEIDVQPGNELLVHHLTVKGCLYEFTGEELAQLKGICEQLSGLWNQNCRGQTSQTIYAWAIGAGPLYLPEEAGFPFGENDSPKSIVIEMHYDNPGKRSDLNDSSSLKILVTPNLRKHDSAILVAGHAVGDTQLIPPKVERFLTRGYCFMDCISTIEESGMNVFSVFLHSHLLGRDMRLRHIRNGAELQPIMEDKHYDFDFQEFRSTPKDTKILSNDTLIMDCYLNSFDRSSVTYGGLSTFEEMCLSFIAYYPKMIMPQLCVSETGPDATFKVFGDDVMYDTDTSNPRNPIYTITHPPTYANMSRKDAMELIDWSNPANARILQDALLSAPLISDICQNTRMPPIINRAYVPPPRPCKDKQTAGSHQTTPKLTSAASISFASVISLSISVHLILQ